MKVIFLSMVFAIILGGCGFTGANEQVRQEPRKTTFRSTEEVDLENVAATPAPQKVPGEAKRPGR